MKYILLFLPIFLFSSHVDFGKHGFEYEIKERSFLLDIEEGVKEISQEEVQNEIKKQFYIQAMGEKNLSKCNEQEIIKEFDYTILPEDIYTPTGRLYQKKGTKITSYLPQALDICFVDGTNMKQLKEQVAFFDKETNKKCTYMISNRNIMEVYKEFPDRDRDMYPSKKGYEERFNVKCNPTRVHLIHNDRIKYQYNLDNFKKEE